MSPMWISKLCFAYWGYVNPNPCWYFIIVFVLLFITVAVITPLCIVGHHFSFLMSLFHGHVPMLKFTLVNRASLLASVQCTVIKFQKLTQSSENTDRLRKGPRSESFSISFPSALDNGDGIHRSGKVTI